MDRKTARETWTKQIERWRQSGLSYAAFAREHGINEQTLRWWRIRLDQEAQSGQVVRERVELSATTSKVARKRGASSKKPSPLTFIEVATTAAVAAPLEIVVAAGIVRVTADFDATTLGRVLDVLKERT